MTLSPQQEAARQLAEDIVCDVPETPADASSLVLHEAELDKYTPVITESGFLTSLGAQSNVRDFQSLFADILILQRYLNHLQAYEIQEHDHSPVLSRVIRRLTVVILPPPIFAKQQSYVADQEGELSLKLAYFHNLSYHGLQCLAKLPNLDSLSEDDVVRYYICLAAFTDRSDLWTTEATLNEAQSLIERLHMTMTESDGAKVLSKLLQDNVKPNFMGSISPSVTQEGRRTISQPRTARSYGEDDAAVRPWKYRNVFTPTVLRHVLEKGQNLKPGFIEENWSLLIPPILTLIDDPSPYYKRVGCFDLRLLLKSMPTAMIARTGLGVVLEEAMIPCLMYLPTLTEEADSLLLLHEAHTSLLDLARVRFPDMQHREQKSNCLYRILRHGVYKAFANSSEHVRINELLMQCTANLIEELGSNAITQIKPIIQMCAHNLTNPFATTYMPLQKASVAVLNVLITCTWARIGHHVPEILQGLIACWLGLEEETPTAEVDVLTEHIFETAHMLLVSTEPDMPLEGELQALMESDARTQEFLSALGSIKPKVPQSAT